MKLKMTMIDHIRSMRIRNKIIVFYFTLVLISIGLSSFLYTRISNNYLDGVIYDFSINEVQNHNKSLEILLEDISSYSKEVVSSPSIQTALDSNQEQIYRLKQVDEELASSIMFDNKISSIYIFDFEGKKYYRDKQIFKNIQLDEVMGKPFYQDLLDLKGGYIFNFNGDGLIDDEGYDYLSFFRIINSNVDHKPVGLMMINIEDTTIKELFNIEDDSYRTVAIRERVYDTEMVFGDVWTVFVQDREEEQPEKTDVMERIERELATVFDRVIKQKLYYSVSKVDRNDIVLAGINNDAYSWMIAEVRQGRDRSSMIATFNIAIIIILAINSLMIVYGSFLFAGYITNPITELTKSMKAVEEGSFIPVKVVENHDEIGNLGVGYNYMIIEIQRLIKEVIREQQVIKKAELRIIMEQIKPHFLYNTLDSISSLILLERNEDASNALTALAKFYRNSLSDGRFIVTLRTEFEIIRNYLLIQDIRYHGLFEVTYDIDEKALELKVPKFMLQPLVENSFYHGIRPLGMDGLIRVSAKFSENKLVIEVEDNGMGMEDQDIERVFFEASDDQGDMSSIGLPATIKRIRHMYGNASSVTIDNKGDGTVIRIEVTETNGGAAQ